MANRAVSLYRKVKTAEGWRSYPVVTGANGRIKTDVVIVAGEEQVIKGGHFQLRSFIGQKTKWTRIEGGASVALAALKTAQTKQIVRADAEAADLRIVEDPSRVSLKSARQLYIDGKLARGSMESAEVYGRSVDEFIAASGKTYSDELDHSAMDRFLVALRKRGMSDRTVSNSFGHAKSFLRFLKIDPDVVAQIAGAKPKYEKTLPEIYSPADLKRLFASLTEEYDLLLFDVLLTCGLREQEAMHLEFADIDRQQRTLKVQSKPRWDFKVKDAEERELPLSKSLVSRIDRYRKTHPGTKLVFGAGLGTTDTPDGHLLRRLKNLARRAELNCGSCEGCNAPRQECEQWFLHKFRATYITTLLRNGLDLRTVMELSGHSDLASVERYIRPAEGKEVQAKVNAIKWR